MQIAEQLKGNQDVVFTPIFPTSQGQYALGSPDGAILRPEQQIKIVFAGRKITGTVIRGPQGYLFRAKDGSVCGLCPNMRVVSPRNGVNGEKLSEWVHQNNCWIYLENGEVLVALAEWSTDPFILFRLPAMKLPSLLRPETDDIYEYQPSIGHIFPSEREQGRRIRSYWQHVQAEQSRATFVATETVTGRYRAMMNDEGIVCWIDTCLLDILAPTLARLNTYRFEATRSQRFRVYAPNEGIPVAILPNREA